MSQEFFLSFLMPVYNAEKDLPAALDSIVSQNDGTIEVICVNDGSKDSSGRILQEYAHRYPYSKFTTDLPDESGNTVGDVRYFEGADIIKLQSDCINRFRDNTPLIPHTVLPTPWAKNYNRGFLTKNNLEFRREVTHEEDVTFNFEALSHVTRAKAVDYVLYYHHWSVQLESHRYCLYIFESAKKTFAAYRGILQYCRPNRSDIAEPCKYRVIRELQYCIYLEPKRRLNLASYSERRKQFKMFLKLASFKGNVWSWQAVPLRIKAGSSAEFN